MCTAGLRRRSAFLLLFALCLVLAAPPAALAQQTSAEPEVSAKFYPEALWGPTPGFGIGVGVEVENVPAARMRFLATAQPAQHEGLYSLAFTTADLHAAPRYLLLKTRYATTGRQWFYGLGPAAAEGDRIAVEKRSFDAALRFGQRFFGGRLLAEPRLALRADGARDFENDDDGAFARLDPASQENLRASLGRLPGSQRAQLGLAPGLRLAFDTRDQRGLTTRGFYAEAAAHQYESLDDLDLRFRQYAFSAYGFLPMPLGERHVLALRAQLALTDRLGGARVPFYLLPVLEDRLLPGFPRDRFFGHDRLALGAQYRFPVWNAFGLLELEGFLGAGAGSVYDDLGEQFDLALTFDDALAPNRESYPLRPTASTGLRLLPLFRDQAFFSVAAGYSAEGFNTLTFRFVYDGQTLRPARP